MSVRAKMTLSNITSVEYGGTFSSKEYNFSAVYDDKTPENARFAKASPSGSFKICIDNPHAQEFFNGKVGKYFYFDVTEVPTEPK